MKRKSQEENQEEEVGSNGGISCAQVNKEPKKREQSK